MPTSRKQNKQVDAIHVGAVEIIEELEDKLEI
jgi:hypothetical protein